MLPGFERLPGGEGRGATPSSPTQTAAIRSRDDQGAGDDESLSLWSFRAARAYLVAIDVGHYRKLLGGQRKQGGR